jgi:hypothetical protein
LQKNAKIHPKTLQKLINNNTTNNTNTNTINSNNTNSNNIINNIKIELVKFGDENLEKLLNKNEMKEIINKMCLCVEESIKKVHFNKNRPEFNNIFITNLRASIAHIFDGSQFIVAPKNDIVNQLFDKHFSNIESFISENDFEELNFSETKQKKLLEFINSLNDDTTVFIDYTDNEKKYPNRKSFKIKLLKELIYNNSNIEKLKNFQKSEITKKSY